MKLVEFTRHQSPFAAGERAAFAPVVAARYEAAKVGRIVGTVDDKGRILVEQLVGDPEGDAAAGGETEPAPPVRTPRSSRQG